MLGALRVRSLYARVDRKQAAFIKRVLAGTGLNREVIMEIKRREAAGKEECRKGIGVRDTDKGDVQNMEIAINGAVW